MSPLEVLESLKAADLMVYHEIVTQDDYGMARLDRPPAFVLDIGANIGIFSAAAAVRWPEAHIVAVEPHRETFAQLKLNMGRILAVAPIRMALGIGAVTLHASAESAGQAYLPPGPGESPEPSDLPIRPLSYLLSVRKFDFVKIDCEGAEIAIASDPENLAAFHRVPHISMELHFWNDEYRDQLSWLVGQMTKTHDVTAHLHHGGGIVWMDKKR